VAAPADKFVGELQRAGARFVDLPMDHQGANPALDAMLFMRFLGLLWKERPDAFLGYTIKPNVYGGIAARVLRIPAINNVAGLGTLFIKDSWQTRVAEVLYRVGLSRARRVFFQNPDDPALFLKRGLIDARSIELLPGSGIDTEYFRPLPGQLPSDRPFTFLLSARLVWDKGIGEFIQAARILRAEGVAAEFQLLGFLGVPNRTAVPSADVEAWEREGLIRYLGEAHDVRPHIAAADCVVLPSYREGMPRSLLEAASMGKPVITSDAVGCRSAIEDRVTGFMCRVRDAEDLAAKMREMVDLEPDERKSLGEAGRRKMIGEFDERIVVDKYLGVLAQIRSERRTTVEDPA
jgi:glycosyltransferase involved in cell wall biosynthesis